jgi:hypothetical protein
MKMRTSALILLCSICLGAFGQYQDRNWVFGRPVSGNSNAVLYFGNQPIPAGPTTTFPGGNPGAIGTSNGNEQWAIVTNSITGNIIFYTDGVSVFDHLHQPVQGLNLGANVSSAQPVAIAPVPRSDQKSAYNEYYIFTNGTGSFMSSYQIGTIEYRIFNHAMQTFSPSTPLPGPYSTNQVMEGMKIIPSDSADILWLVTSLIPSGATKKRYVVYKINKDVITYHGTSDFGPDKELLPSGASAIGFITYNNYDTPAGITRVGFAQQYSPAVFTIDFDNYNGQFLTNTLRTVNTGLTLTLPTIYSLEFSPQGRFLYYTVYRTTATANALYQVDLLDPVLNPTLVKSFNAPYAGGIKTGPDSLIYHIHDDGFDNNTLKVGRILLPNQKFIPGTTPLNQFYQENFATYPGVFGIGLCEFLIMPKTIITPPIGTGEVPGRIQEVEVFPNPSNSQLTIRLQGNTQEMAEAVVIGANGQVVLRKGIPETNDLTLDIRHLPVGWYILKINGQTFTRIEKFAIVR